MSSLDERIKNVCVHLDEYIEKLDETDQNVIKLKQSLKWFIDNDKYYAQFNVQRPDLGEGAWVNGFVSKGHVCMHQILMNQRGGIQETDPFYLIQQITSDDPDMTTTVRTLSSYMDSFWALCTMQHADILYTHKTEFSTHKNAQVSQHFNCLLAKLKNESA
jgi:hypothetical protein